jgi:protein-L-isoaspartate(D-aspartate) O-methyltransferase
VVPATSRFSCPDIGLLRRCQDRAKSGNTPDIATPRPGVNHFARHARTCAWGSSRTTRGDAEAGLGPRAPGGKGCREGLGRSGTDWLRSARFASQAACQQIPADKVTKGCTVADFGTQRMNMVESQVRPSDVTDRHLMRVMQGLAREDFIPAWGRSVAYADEDVAVTRAAGGHGARHLLAPRVLAKLIQAAEVAASDRVLDVGCATGYSTAVLAGLASDVTGLEEDAGLAGSARAALQVVKSGATIQFGPLAHGWSAGAPYDVILLNGSIPAVPTSLLDQLRDGGRLVAIVTGASGAGRTQDTVTGTALVYTKRGVTISSRIVFDAGAPRLPGFGHVPGFVF